MSTKKKSNQRKAKPTPASIIWFEIPADNIQRARTFYKGLFGWKINQFPGMPGMEYWHIDTGGADASPDGGMMKRMCPEHSVINYINVPSVDKSADKVVKLGGSICKSKTAVPNMGYFVICQDTENNTFALWQVDRGAK
jgi:predicted enzyme related to lactoylglutathione lyase